MTNARDRITLISRSKGSAWITKETRSTCSPAIIRRPPSSSACAGRDMVPISGGTQALKGTINVVLDIQPHTPTAISVPRPYAAVILKAAAYLADSRDRDRHLYDAAALLACIEETLTEKESLGGSDRRRIRTLTQRLPGDHPAWLALDQVALVNAQAALRILSSA